MADLQKTLIDMQNDLNKFTCPGGPFDKYMKNSEKLVNEIAEELKKRHTKEECDCLNEQSQRLRKLLAENQQQMAEKCISARMEEARTIVGNAIISGETDRASKQLSKLNKELTACMNAEMKAITKQMNEIERIVKKCTKK